MGSLEVQPNRFRERIDRYHLRGEADLRLVYIPTHRDCAKVLGAVAQEVRTAAGRSADEFQLLLIDDRPANLAEDNRAAARRVADEVGVVVNWLDVDAWSGYVTALTARSGLSAEDQSVARSALLKPSGSYAGGMNKASLLASHVGAATLHRRDSDEFPVYDGDSGAGTLEVEIAALSTALPTGNGEDIAPYVVGSSVDGEPTKDHRDLISVSGALAADLEAVSRRRAGEVASEPVVGTIPIGSGMQVERDFTGRTQVGVSASREVHHWIPEMPAVGMLGTDHFQKGLLYQLDLPVYWHPLSARHEYEPRRAGQTDHAQLGRYAVAELRHVVLRHYWNAAYDTLAGLGRGLFEQGRFRSETYAEAFTDVLRTGHSPAEAIAQRFTDIYAEAAYLASGETAGRLRTRVEALRTEQPRVVGYVQESIQEFARLTCLWPRLVAGAASVRPSD